VISEQDCVVYLRIGSEIEVTVEGNDSLEGLHSATRTIAPVSQLVELPLSRADNPPGEKS